MFSALKMHLQYRGKIYSQASKILVMQFNFKSDRNLKVLTGCCNFTEYKK
jgi:hypothetical protein